MAEDEGKQGDLKFYQNQPYDMEVDLNNEEDADENEIKDNKNNSLNSEEEADAEGKGDLKYYQNQPYDMEVDLNNDDEGEENDHAPSQKKSSKKENLDEQQEEANYQEIAAPQVKELPKFDISKFEDIPASAEAKELLSIMKK